MTADSSNPVAVLESGGTPLGGVIQIATGDVHTCALLSGGTVRCWGSGGNGRLGDGTTKERLNPVEVLASGTASSDPVVLGGVIQIATGREHTCALLSAGTVRCWGSGGNGRLGDGTGTQRLNPVEVLESGSTQGTNVLGGVTQIATGGFHTCALLAGKTVRCWGFGGRGRLGDGTETQRLNPVEVLESGSTQGTNVLGGVTQIATGGFHTCALLEDVGRTVRCWGSGDVGQLGDGTTTTQRLNPVAVLESGGTPLGQVTRIATGGGHTCALLEDVGRTVRCWGLGTKGQLGDGATTNRSLPVAVLESGGTPLGQVTGIATGGGHTCALLEDVGRTVRCWGLGDKGQLGDGATTNQSLPVAVLASGSAALDPVVFSVIVVHLVDSGASGESVSRLEMACDVIPAQVGELITCTVTGGDPGIDILWRAAYNPVFAGQGVTLDADGIGTFAFTVPAAALGQVVTVELVDWLAPVSLGVVGGPVPTSVPSGEGPVPVWSLVLLALAGGLALRRKSAVGVRG